MEYHLLRISYYFISFVSMQIPRIEGQPVNPHKGLKISSFIVDGTMEQNFDKHKVEGQNSAPSYQQ